MKSIKSILTLAFFLTCNLTFTQPPGGGQRGQQEPPPIPSAKQIGKMIIDLSIDLALSLEQKTQISDMYQNHFDEVRVLTETKPKREVMDVKQAEFENDVRALLSDEQKIKFNIYLKNQNSQKRKK